MSDETKAEPLTNDEIAVFAARLSIIHPPDGICLMRLIDSLRAELAAMTERAEKAERSLFWEDVEDEWADAICKAHPVRSGSYETYGTAMTMVGHRHSKGELVALVNWLLMRAEAAETALAEEKAKRER